MKNGQCFTEMTKLNNNKLFNFLGGIIEPLNWIRAILIL